MDAVIDKDLASGKLAAEVGVDVFVIATDVAGAYLDYGGPKEELLRRLSPDEAEGLLAAGRFPAGSMGPKIEAGGRFCPGHGQKGGHLLHRGDRGGGQGRDGDGDILIGLCLLQKHVQPF